LRYITHWVDSNFLTITLDDWKNLTVFQILAFKIINMEIRKWRSKKKPLILY